MTRTYVRYDTGRFANDMAKLFISASHTEADKWKGEGKAKKDHVDFGFSLDLSEDNKILGSVPTTARSTTTSSIRRWPS
jgi:iron complex outermembrane receptor protein